jgi:cellulose synthase/poly-beta-1,6-N-acetylglucosamine synthase-like glycosyltransferase
LAPELLFWFSLSFILYTYAGYPALLFAWSRLFPRPVRKAYMSPEPPVSVVIAARNEEKNIRARIEDLARQDYPADKLEIIVVSDGSRDATAAIVGGLVDEFGKNPGRPALELIEVAEHRGKPHALNTGVRAAGGDFVVFTDARQKFNAAAIRELVANFSDPAVGSVSGELVFLEEAESEVRAEMGFYWGLEKRIRQMESTIDSVPGATGAVYAIRRGLYPAVPDETLIDDVYIPLCIVLNGFRSVFDGSALAYDLFSKNFSQEKRRKVRTLVGNYQLLRLLPQLLSPVKSRIFLRYLSHKVFRLFVPFMFLLFLITAILSEGAVYRLFLTGAVGGLMLAAVSRHVDKVPVINRLSRVSSTFVSLNYFAFLAFLQWVHPGKKGTW